MLLIDNLCAMKEQIPKFPSVAREKACDALTMFVSGFYEETYVCRALSSASELARLSEPNLSLGHTISTLGASQRQSHNSMFKERKGNGA
jgi:hypothetical protein